MPQTDSTVTPIRTSPDGTVRVERVTWYDPIAIGYRVRHDGCPTLLSQVGDLFSTEGVFEWHRDHCPHNA